jgi:hypothetical protein
MNKIKCFSLFVLTLSFCLNCSAFEFFPKKLCYKEIRLSNTEFVRIKWKFRFEKANSELHASAYHDINETYINCRKITVINANNSSQAYTVDWVIAPLSNSELLPIKLFDGNAKKISDIQCSCYKINGIGNCVGYVSGAKQCD